MILKKKFLICMITSLLMSTMVIPPAIAIDMDRLKPQHHQFDPFLIRLSQTQLDQINQFLKDIADHEQRDKLQSIMDSIIENEVELNVASLFEIISEYAMYRIYHASETTDVIDDVYMFLLTLIQERLGWTYEFFEKTSDIIDAAQRVWNDRNLPAEIINETKKLITTLTELQSLLSCLIQKEYRIFLREWSPGIIITDVTQLITSIQILATDLGILIGDIQRLINDVSGFITWISNEPWKQPITIYGEIIQGLRGVSNATIECNNVIAHSDQDGMFEFEVEIYPSNSSIPTDSFYGLHECVIQVSYDNQTKNTPVALSYVFSDGSLYWYFLLKNNRTRQDEQRNHWCSFFTRITDDDHRFQALLPILNRIRFRLDPLIE